MGFLSLKSYIFQLLGQAARNMVIQEDAILHSEDVSLRTGCVFVRERSQLSVNNMSSVFAESEKNVHHRHTFTIPVSVSYFLPNKHLKCSAFTNIISLCVNRKDKRPFRKSKSTQMQTFDVIVTTVSHMELLLFLNFVSCFPVWSTLEISKTS